MNNRTFGWEMRHSPKIMFFQEMSTIRPELIRDSLPVISVGTDTGLLALREQIIGRTTGLAVISVIPIEARCIARSAETHLWVFCSTVEHDDLLLLADAIRTHSPKSKLVLLDGDRISHAETKLFDCVVDPFRNIDGMVAAIKQLAIRATVSTSDGN